MQVDSSPAEPQGKPKITGVGSLALLQQIFPTQESNWGLLHCRWILYQLSYQGSPDIFRWTGNPSGSPCEGSYPANYMVVICESVPSYFLYVFIKISERHLLLLSFKR